MIEFLLLSAVFGAGTIIAGWWCLPLIAALWCVGRRGLPWRAGAAAAVAWVVLPAFTLQWGPLSRLMPRIGGVLGLPGWVFLLLPPVYAWLLAWSAARVVARAPAQAD